MYKKTVLDKTKKKKEVRVKEIKSIPQIIDMIFIGK